MNRGFSKSGSLAFFFGTSAASRTSWQAVVGVPQRLFVHLLVVEM